MPQAILPLFSEDITLVNQYIGFQQKGDTVYWFQGHMPVFRHHVHDHKYFRLFCSQLIINGNVTAADLSRSLNINKEKLSRWARLDGQKSFEKKSK
jgi:hypothetical protein